VTKTDSKDGKTEWFLASLEVIKEGIDKIRKAMYYIHNDQYGWKPESEAI